MAGDAVGKLVYMLACADEDNIDKLSSMATGIRDRYCNFSEKVFSRHHGLRERMDIENRDPNRRDSHPSSQQASDELIDFP